MLLVDGSDMISIREMIHTKPETQVPPMRVVLVLLEAMGLHAVQVDPEDRENFREICQGIARDMQRAPDTAAQLIVAGKAIEALESYNRAIERQTLARASEMKSVLALMTEALLKVGANADVAATNLRQIGKDIGRASEVNDIRALKGKLANSLDVICQEVARQESHSELLKQQIHELEQRTALLQKNSFRTPAQDPVTGMPGMSQAIELFEELNAAGTQYYVLVIWMERLTMINSRFGFANGDQAIVTFSQQIAQRLQPGDQLFRWRGPCFIAVLQRRSVLQAVRSEAARVASIKAEFNVELASRLVMLTLSAVWTLLPVTKEFEAGTLINKIDAFMADQSKTPSAAPLPRPA